MTDFIKKATYNGSSVLTSKKDVKTNRITVFNRVITSSRKLYARQLDKNANVKKRCIEQCVTKYYPEPDKFWAEFESKKEEILDRGSFKARCNQEGLCPENVAEHLLFEGSGVVKKTLETGFAHLKGSQKFYTEPISTSVYRIHKVETGEVRVVNAGLCIEKLSDIPQAVVV